MLSIFSCACWLFVCLLWKYVCLSPLPTFSCIIWSFFAIEFVIHFGNWHFIRCVVSEYFLPFYRLPFHFVDCFIYCTEAYKFAVVPLVYFCFCCLCFRCHVQKIIAITNVKELILYFSFESFMVSGFTFKSLINFELIFVDIVK